MAKKNIRLEDPAKSASLAHMFWRDAIFVFLGGGLGAASRFALNLGIHNLVKDTSLHRFPVGIFACNILGCFLIGCAFGLLADRQNSPLIPFLITGFLGGFTTFSTFGKDTYGLFSQNLHTLGILNILASVLVGLVAVYAGLKLMSS